MADVSVPAPKKRRGPGRPFVKGQSGNPTGYPKELAKVQRLARTHTVAAIEALARGLNDPKLYPTCAQALLDRAWGKPVQPVDGQVDAQLVVRIVKFASD